MNTIQTHPFLDLRDRGVVHSTNETKQSQGGDSVLNCRILGRIGRRLGTHATNGGAKLSGGINAARKHCAWKDPDTTKGDFEIRQRAAVEMMQRALSERLEFSFGESCPFLCVLYNDNFNYSVYFSDIR